MRSLMLLSALMMLTGPLLSACRGPEKTPRTKVREVDEPSSKPENDQPDNANQ